MKNHEMIAEAIKNARGAYTYQGANLNKLSKDETNLVANFAAIIIREVIYHDGLKQTKHVTIIGMMDPEEPNGEPVMLPEITIPASQLDGDSWVSEKWGCRPIVFGSGKDLSIALRLYSRPERENIYRHTGWAKVDGADVYLTNAGAITAKGLDASIKVELPTELQRYSIPRCHATAEDIAASIAVTNIAPRQVTWPMLLATYRAAICEADFAIHLAGRTGTRKSEICSLMQSHYGEELDARHLPGSWSSTDNALEALAYLAKNALFTIDDYVPQGTSYDLKKLAGKADRLFRGQGNQSGRQRMTDTSNMQGTMFPRGIIMSTGEDVPEGHSVRGRMMIVELQKDETDLDRLTTSQAQRPRLSTALGDWIRWLCEHPEKRAEFIPRRDELRREFTGVGHSRTPTLMADLLVTLEMMAEWIDDRKLFKGDSIAQLAAIGEEAVKAQGEEQLQYLETADPVVTFLQTIQNMLANQQAHLKTKNGGVPKNAAACGWREDSYQGQMPEYKANGARLGWINMMQGEVYIEPSVFTIINKASGGKIGISEATLCKRLKEAGALKRVDATRQRTTVRVSLEGSNRNVLAIDVGQIFSDEEETPEDSAPAANDESFEFEE